MVERTTCSARAVHVESEACDSASREMKCGANRESHPLHVGLSGANDMPQRVQEIVDLTNMKRNSTRGVSGVIRSRLERPHLERSRHTVRASLSPQKLGRL
jgi:hypothetical protein